MTAATFGKINVGVSSDNFLSGRKRVNRYALPTEGSVAKLSVYLAPTSTAGEQVIKGVIYSDAAGKPQALLGVSEQLTFTSTMPAGWYDLPFPAPIKLASGNYWIGAITGNSSHVAGFRYDSVSGSRDYNVNNYGTGPTNPFGSAKVDAEQTSLYATYTPAATATAAPAVTGLSPGSGPQAGGTAVTISGANLSGTTEVRFGSRAAASFAVNTASSITALSPAGTGTVDVSVSGSGGTSETAASDRFSYLAASQPPPTLAPPPPGTAGEVRFVKNAGSTFDSEDIEANGAWIREHFARMVTWSPFFDLRTSWYPNAWAYQDAYAIYVSSALAAEHPEWILKNAGGEPLYIPWGSPPSQYAADISNPAFRRFWIERTAAIVAHGYKGVFVDDVDMWANVANVKGERQTPISGVTGQAISDESWREYLATFLAELRAALPGYEIVDNSVWYAGASSGNRGPTNPLVRSQVEHASVINIEHGASDGGIIGGTGAWSLYNLFAYVDEVHALGRGVVMAESSPEVAAMEYNLAAYFLISTGADYVTGGGSTQNLTNFWSGWGVNLGEATGPRERSSSGLWKRTFGGGVVYLLEPGAATQTITLPAPMKNVTLGTVSSVTLSARQAVVLTR